MKILTMSVIKKFRIKILKKKRTLKLENLFAFWKRKILEDLSFSLMNKILDY